MTSHPDFNKETNGTDAAKAFATQIRGKTILITGASPNGLGQATAHAIAGNAPGLIIISGRSQAKLDETAAGLRKSFPSVPVRILIVDLGSFKSIRTAAAEVNAYPEDIDVLINNAGVMAIAERQLTEDGLEMQFGTNHIGHFLFTNLILGKLEATAAKSSTPGSTRIINLSSFGHQLGPVRFSDPNFEGKKELPSEEVANWDLIKSFYKIEKTNGYEAWASYGQAKTANVLFALSLRDHLYKRGILSFAVHPGGINTDLSRNMSSELYDGLMNIMDPNSFKTHDQGVSTTIVAAFDPKLDEKSGPYFDDCQVGQPNPWATNAKSAEKLWTLSEEIVGQKFPL
ncbi:MAG: hypothetical protein M4579_000444 [Chaenotheca gracillima]|nr:MAG: hypothetical protein M4579_000444 [Chaenotheca gracillima]